MEDDPDPRRGTFTGEAVRRWGRRTGQPGRRNRWSLQGGRRPGNRTEEPCEGIDVRGRGAGQPGKRHRAEGGRGTGRPGSRRQSVRGSSRATGEADERSGGRTGQPGKPTEKRIARRGASSDGRCHWSSGRLTPQDRSVVDHPLQESPRAARWLRLAAQPGALRFCRPADPGWARHVPNSGHCPPTRARCPRSGTTRAQASRAEMSGARIRRARASRCSGRPGRGRPSRRRRRSLWWRGPGTAPGGRRPN